MASYCHDVSRVDDLRELLQEDEAQLQKSLKPLGDIATRQVTDVRRFRRAQMVDPTEIRELLCYKSNESHENWTCGLPMGMTD